MIKEAISSLVSGRSLTMDEAAMVMEEIMQGEATQAQFGAFVTALRLKGETVDEIVGLAKTMRSKVVPVVTAGAVVDTCGTGGDGSCTFNISTTAAFVAAGAGLKVAKHGNRAMSSQCGSADVLEALGVKIDLNAGQVQRCLEEVGMGFMFAPIFHPAMKYAVAPRREIGIRTVFNILGPLTNPAGAQAQVLGVADGLLAEKMALVLHGLGCKHALVVHGDDGLDEVTVTGKTEVYEVKDNYIKSYFISPEDFGLPRAELDCLRGGTAAENAACLRNILGGATGPQRDVVLLNAAAALMVGGGVDTLQQGIARAGEIIDSGQATAKLEQLVRFSQSLVQEGE
ncbi:MAG TPA: anthranilate phosphoribosyltransferase [Dehalococcoidales bacterium]|nr:anthranilate phosphoribosyltransferase [Dehalococcoidales bacterium]